MTAVVEALRTCRDCGLQAWTEEDLEGLRKDPRCRYGRKNLCRPCANARSLRWQAQNADRKREYNRAYYGGNRERILDYQRAYHESNRERVLERQREWRKANPEYYRAYHSTTRTTAIDIYGGKCVHCGSIENLEFDHVNNDGKSHREIESSPSMLLRIANTGQRLDDWELQLLCQSCHLEKTVEHRGSHKEA